MNRIDQLIAKLCPEGVEFKQLMNIARIKNGKDHKMIGDGDIPVYGSGGIMRYVDRFVYDKPSVLIPRKGSLGNLFYVDVPFWNVDTIFYTEIDESLIYPKFFYYYLTIVGLGEMNQAGGVPSQTQAVLNTLLIPVPPLEIQHEIVKILDTFSQLEAELEAELEARKRQYRHYRDQLLNFEGREDVEWKRLGEVGTFIRGSGIQKTDFRTYGIGCIHYGQIHTHYGTWTTDTISFVENEFAKRLRKAKTGDLVIATTSEDDDAVAKAVAWLGDDDIAVSTDAYIFEHQLDPKYASFFFQTKLFQSQKKPLITGTKVRRISGDNLSKINIPVPSVAEQARIVEILDHFNALVSDLSSGLPAEIQARRKQYEHYRDRLLSFKEAV